MSGKTAAPYEIPYATELDTADVPRDTKAISERVTELLKALEPSWFKNQAAGTIFIANAEGHVTGSIPVGDVTITPAGVTAIGALKVLAAMLGNEAVESGKLKNLAVTAAKLAVEAVTGEKLGSESVETAKIKALAVTAAKIAAEAIESGKIKAEAVTAEKIANLAVTAAKLAAESVEEGKIKNLAVGTGKIAELAVTTGKIAALAVTEAKIAGEAVTSAKIANLAVTEGKLAELAVTEPKIADKAVTSRKFKPSTGFIQMTETLKITNVEWKLLPGMKIEVTASVESHLMVWFSVFKKGAVASTFRPKVDTVLDNSNKNARSTLPTEGMYTFIYRFTLAAGAHTIEIGGTSNGTENEVFGESTNGFWMLVSA